MAKWDKWLKDGNSNGKQKFSHKLNEFDESFGEDNKRHEKKSRRRQNRDKRSAFDEDFDI
ncbi:hypothetical protein CS022_02280 [Veronia nyctiphanis]|uniref:Uncharacterized protein n=1 Tax=Veronia nyctiphanis TaxID=1278244 RepID=A0A4V1LT98_9GAMM|nr:hypothetical protein [Veronia nyctiphanis]RXJ74448.1 hypothetical protein CS022_02280 [Veronia nyctiphanis]